jgi:hypothetical protein
VGREIRPAQPGEVVSDGVAWRRGEGRGIPGGAVKCVEIRRNTDGVGSALAAKWEVAFSLGRAASP